eukprot:CAMPEP_0119343640 /NCGR_PEP_ID=MMETSP1333-20130426/106555_1 /TAXON_ID=418940 /ORGANISM="Scyphosphaera apsteinii, Strain RCC1455" /LENGTH=374 /DNA_ID=CAMNT_0007356043 /DNA_START=731 /DNA_END=1852 /DNA_ORIENTATION=-
MNAPVVIVSVATIGRAEVWHSRAQDVFPPGCCLLLPKAVAEYGGSPLDVCPSSTSPLAICSSPPSTPPSTPPLTSPSTPPTPPSTPPPLAPPFAPPSTPPPCEITPDVTGRVILSDLMSAIAESAFDGCTSLSSVIIPDSVTSIGNYALRSTSLSSVIIPDSVTSIGNRGFMFTPLASVIIPDSVKTIGRKAFRECTPLTSVTIGNSVKSIANEAFKDTCLSSVLIPDSVTSIGNDVFPPGCCLLLPKAVAEYGGSPLDVCPSSTSPLAICSSPPSTPPSTPPLTSPSTPPTPPSTPPPLAPPFAPPSTPPPCEITPDVTGRVILLDLMSAIAESAFDGCTSLSSVIIPDSVTSIGNYAFRSTSLSSVIIPDSV